MTNEQQEKIKRFLNDPLMSHSVYQVLLDAFLKPRKDADVQVLAASRLSIDFLNDAWKELEKLKHIDTSEKTKNGQVGL